MWFYIGVVGRNSDHASIKQSFLIVENLVVVKRNETKNIFLKIFKSTKMVVNLLNPFDVANLYLPTHKWRLRQYWLHDRQCVRYLK